MVTCIYVTPEYGPRAEVYQAMYKSKLYKSVVFRWYVMLTD